jgi:deoxyribodipyrimidine photo-lyase
VIQHERIRRVNRRLAGDGRYVLYWMQAAQRADYNHALAYAIDRANELKKPVVVVFALTAEFPEANARHYHFMLEGLRETVDALKERGIQMVVRAQSSIKCIPELAREACTSSS